VKDGPELGFPFPDPPAVAMAVEVAPGILWLRLPLPMALNHVNVYALADGDGWTIIDTGMDTPETRDNWQSILGGPLSGRPVTRVIATHHHPDHIGLAGWFIGQGAELWMPRTGWLMARMQVLDEQPRLTPQAEVFYRAAGMDSSILAQRMADRPFNFADCVAPLPPGFRRIREGDRISIGDRDWSVRTGEGHAPEHATLWSDDGVVIGGDQFLPTISPNLGVYPNEPMADTVGDWLAACARFAVCARDTDLVLPGHKLPFTGLPLRLAQMQDGHHIALDRIMAALAVPHRAADLFDVLYGRPIRPGEYGLALAEAVGHVNHLALAGRVRGRKDDDGAIWWMRAD
jgi:glyoxylase-like metal-dependent hydrolase (beta-lactamase superfamily II)